MRLNEAIKKLSGLDPRERRLVLIAGIAIGCWAFMSWIVQPLWDQAGVLGEHIERQEQRLHAMGRVLAQAASVEQDSTGGLAADVMETEDTQRVFLGELESLSRTSDVRVNLKPRPVARDGKLSRFDVELDVEGSQDALFGFLDALLGMPRLLTVERLRLSSVPMKEHHLRASLVIQRVALQP